MRLPNSVVPTVAISVCVEVVVEVLIVDVECCVVVVLLDSPLIYSPLMLLPLLEALKSAPTVVCA